MIKDNRLLSFAILVPMLSLTSCPGKTSEVSHASPGDTAEEAQEIIKDDSGTSESPDPEKAGISDESDLISEADSETRDSEQKWNELREKMVQEQIVARGITNPRVIDAMLSVPRHEFVLPHYQRLAYADHPLPIGEKQTISQPLIVALMCDLADISPGDRVLEIGTGSGYHAAVMAAMGAEVYTIEIIESLAKNAEKVLSGLDYENVHVRYGDGYKGWPEHAPFNSIVVTAAPPSVPRPLKDQLAVGGKLVLPVGEREQEMEVLIRTEDGFDRERHGAVRFVPMTGEAQKKKKDN